MDSGTMIEELDTYRSPRGAGGRKLFRHMTFDEASRLSYGEHIWFLTHHGDARQCKINGRVRRWKRDLSRIEIPAKYGLYEYFIFTRSDIERGAILVEVGEQELNR